MRQVNRFVVHPGWKIIIVDLDLNLNDVLKFAALPNDLFEQTDATLSAKEYFALWESLEAFVGDLELPLALEKAISPEVFDPAIFASLCSTNLNMALDRLRRFKCLVGPMVLDIDVTPDGTKSSVYCINDETVLPRALGVFEAIFLTKLARMGTRTQVVPKNVTLQSLPKNIEVYKEYFGITPELGEVNGIEFNSVDAQRPFLTENQVMWKHFEPLLNSQLNLVQASSKTSIRVQQLLMEMIPNGSASVDLVASKMLMSKRTLQRKLAEEDTNFKTIHNNVRKELAKHYLMRSDLSHSQISFLLGFEDPNSFFRAFHSWTGTTPEKMRLSLAK